jgi:hypothetical protein
VICFSAACFLQSAPVGSTFSFSLSCAFPVRSGVIASAATLLGLCTARISAQDFRFPFLAPVFFINFISRAPLLGGPVFASLRFSLSSEPLLRFRSRPRQRPSFLADCWFRFSCRARISSSRWPSCCLVLRPVGSCERPPQALLRLSLISSGQDSSFRFSD